jgi:hypothetical protein
MRNALRVVPQEIDLESQIAAAYENACSAHKRGDDMMASMMMRKFEWLHGQRSAETVRRMDLNRRTA